MDVSSKEKLLQRIVNNCKIKLPKAPKGSTLGLIRFFRNFLVGNKEKWVELVWDTKKIDSETGEVLLRNVTVVVDDCFLAGSTSTVPEDDLNDICSFASRICDTTEKIDEFLDGEFLCWTGNCIKHHHN